MIEKSALKWILGFLMVALLVYMYEYGAFTNFAAFASTFDLARSSMYLLPVLVIVVSATIGRLSLAGVTALLIWSFWLSPTLLLRQGLFPATEYPWLYLIALMLTFIEGIRALLGVDKNSLLKKRILLDIAGKVK